MGWLYESYFAEKPKTMKERKNFIANKLKKWYNGEAFILHDHLTKGDCEGIARRYIYYCSIERNQQRAIFVILFDFDKYRWGYKAMSEDMGPCYYDCPLIILKDVPCPDDEWAIEWRKTVIERHCKQNAKKAAIKSLRPGDEIEFTDACYNGHKKFKVSVIMGNKIYFTDDRCPTLNLIGWQKHDFKILKAV